jgi:hypothetical protein
VSSALPAVSRRRMLLGTAALAALGATAAACGKPPPPPDLDDLMAQLDMARSDSRLASDAATTANPAMRPALAAVSSERSKHAEALSDEIARMTGEPTTSSPTPTTTSVQQATPPTAKDVVAALRTSADSAAKTATQLSGYRAGLLGSIAASCTAGYTVALA